MGSSRKRSNQHHDLHREEEKLAREKKKSKTSKKSNRQHEASNEEMGRTPDDRGESTPASSMMHRVKLEIQVTLPPAAIGSERKYAFRHIRQRLLSRYFPASAVDTGPSADHFDDGIISMSGAGDGGGGALVAFQNLDFSNGGVGEMKSPCYPHLLHFTLQCDGLVFRPQIGGKVFNFSGQDIVVKSCVMTHMELNIYGGVLKAFILSSSLHSAGLTFEYRSLPSQSGEEEKSSPDKRRRSNSIQLHGTASNPGVDTTNELLNLESVGYWVNPDMPDETFSAGKALESFVIDRFNDVNGFLVLEGKNPQLL